MPAHHGLGDDPAVEVAVSDPRFDRPADDKEDKQWTHRRVRGEWADLDYSRRWEDGVLEP